MTYEVDEICPSLFLNSPNPYSIFEQFNENFNDINNCSILNENISYRDNPKFEDMNFNSIYYLEKQKTKWETLKKSIIINEDELKYKCTPLEEIKENFMRIKNTSEIGLKLTKNKFIDDAEKKLCKIKRNRDIEVENNEPCILIKNENEEGEKKKRGRKINITKKTKILHDKYSQDNIIKKIKGKFLGYIVKFLNNLLKQSNYRKKKYKLYKLNYKYINQLKKEEDLEIFKKKLKELLSLEISPKYKKISKLHNKKIINEIFENKDLSNYQVIKFAFELTFKEWIELFTYKKNVYEIIKHNDENIIEEIEKSMIHVDVLLKKILDKNDDNHFFSIFTFFLYNYEEWFLIKRERKHINI